MKGIKKEPTPAKGLTRIDNKLNLRKSIDSTNSQIRRDARVLQYLKSECQRIGTGGKVLKAVSDGLNQGDSNG